MAPKSAHTFLAGAIVALTMLALAACGSSGASTASPQPPKTSTGTPATVGVANTPTLRRSKPERIGSAATI